MDVVGSVSQCDPAYTGLKGNRYYTPTGNATLQCNGARLPLAQVQAKYVPPPFNSLITQQTVHTHKRRTCKE
jgi:hypothetical protein